MSDLALAGGWLVVLAVGLGACVVAHALGLASTYVRDALHVGAGIWIVGWPWWHGGALPIAIVASVAIATFALPLVASHVELAARLVRSVTNGDERWTGLVHYTLAYAVLTAVGFAGAPFPAAAALLSLSLGDGIGGLAGRALGRHHYRAPGGKQKSLEGSVVVALGAMLGIAFAAHLFAASISLPRIIVLGVVAAGVEALSPRGTDNLLVPAVVWTAAFLVTP